MHRFARAAALAVVIAAVTTGCTQAMAGEPSSDISVERQLANCRNVTTDAVNATKRFMSAVDVGDTNAKPDTSSFSVFATACGPNLAQAWSEYIVRTHKEFTPVTLIGKVGAREFLLAMCRDDLLKGISLSDLSDEAQKACRET